MKVAHGCCLLAATVGLIAATALLQAPSAQAAGNIGSFVYSHDTWQELLTVQGGVQLAKDFWAWIGPGGKLHPQYFLEHKGHFVIEGIFLVLILYLLTQSRQKAGPKNEQLTEKVRQLNPRSF